jgi:multidrug efflux system membrane fusion protein
LFKDGVLAQQTLDDINAQVKMSEAALKKNQADLKTLEQTLTQQQSTIDSLSSRLALANYNLSQTSIAAQQDGLITSLNTYVGDYITVGKPLFTIVNNKNWRIIANMKEYHLHDIHPGQKVLISLNSEPFHFYWGTVQSIGRGIARNPTSQQALEYIDPVVDWVRYDYRFPVTIQFDNIPANLYMGEDVRVWVVK